MVPIPALRLVRRSSAPRFAVAPSGVAGLAESAVAEWLAAAGKAVAADDRPAFVVEAMQAERAAQGRITVVRRLAAWLDDKVTPC